MKTLLSIILSILVFTTISAQTNKKLDQENGFLEFKLGDSFSKWKNQVDAGFDFDENAKGYIYTASCCKEFLGYPVANIILEFRNQKLTGIFFTLERFQKGSLESNVSAIPRTSDYDKINAYFTKQYGKPLEDYDYEEEEDEEEVVAYTWAGKKVVLYSHYQFLSPEEGDQMLIEIYDAEDFSE